MANAGLATAVAVVCLIAGAPSTGSFQVERPGFPLAPASPGLLAFSTSRLGNWHGECRKGVSSMKKPAIFTSKAIRMFPFMSATAAIWHPQDGSPNMARRKRPHSQARFPCVGLVALCGASLAWTPRFRWKAVDVRAWSAGGACHCVRKAGSQKAHLTLSLSTHTSVSGTIPFFLLSLSHLCACMFRAGFQRLVQCVPPPAFPCPHALLRYPHPHGHIPRAGARFRSLQQPLGCVATATGGEQQEKQRTQDQQQQQQQKQVDGNGEMGDAPTPLQSIAQEPKSAQAAFGAPDQAPPDVELMGRQEFQDLCVPKLVRVGQSVPADWTQGVHLSSPAWDLRRGEIAVLLGTDGSRKFCRIDSIMGGESGESEALLEGGNSVGLDIQAEVGRKQGSQVMRVQGSRLAKVLPLQLSDLQRLAALKSEVVVERGDERESGTDGPPATILESLRRLMDVDKTTKVEDLPFQPMLSSSRGSKKSPREDVAVATVKGGDSPFSERWGELNGWWTDKVNNKELFEVELVRPLGLALTPVEGEGLVVSSVDTGGHAECAGMRIGDVVTLSSLDLSDLDSTSKASSTRDILTAVVSEESETVRMRFERGIDQPVSTTFSSKRPWVAKSRERGGSKEGGGGDGKANERDLEFEVEKPVGITLIELAGYGVFVKEVMPGSHAAIVGIKVGDRITSTSSPLSYDAGTSFDRGTTYTTASSRSSSSSDGGRRSGSRNTLSSVLSAVSSGGDKIAIGIVRDKAGKALVDLANASPLDSKVEGPASRLKVDASLTEKVRGALLDEEERVVEAKGRPLKVNLDLLNYNARRARERKQPEKALSMLAKCIRLDPYDGRAWLATAKHFERQRNYNAAREWLNKGLQYSPSNPYLLQSLGVLEERTGDLVAARALYVKSTKIDPGHAPSWVSLGKLEERTKRQERARECYRAATKADPLNYYAWQAWAVLEARLGNTNEARRLFEVCSEVNPNNAAVWQAWGVLESRLRNYDVAVDCFQRGLQVSPRNTYVLQAWAVLEWKRDDLVAANELFEKAITYKPGDGGVYQAYAMLLRDRKLYSSARAMYVSPISPSFLLSLSLSLSLSSQTNKQTHKHTNTQTHTHTPSCSRARKRT